MAEKVEMARIGKTLFISKKEICALIENVFITKRYITPLSNM